MNWKQLLFPRPVRALYKASRRTKNRIVPRLLTRLVFLGWPSALTSSLGSRRNEVQVILYKQRIFSLTVGNRFLRFASGASVRKLEKEYTSWQQMRELGLASIIVNSIELRRAGSGMILETDRLWPIAKEDQLAVTFPIIRELVARARPLTCGVPATVSAGLEFAKALAGGTLPASFAHEEEIRSCFARGLLCGPTHQDLHYKNVMRDLGGRPVLVDLKSCMINAPVCLDLLTFVCKYLQTRDSRNAVEIAYMAQRRGWQFPELDPVLSIIDLDRHMWGPVYLIYSMGRWAQKSHRVLNHSNVYGKLLRGLLSRQWRAATA